MVYQITVSQGTQITYLNMLNDNHLTDTIGWLLMGGIIVNISYSLLMHLVPGLSWVTYTLLSGSFTTAVMAVLLYYNERLP
jgi:hypothetical protein